jgi:hypothetical protein
MGAMSDGSTRPKRCRDRHRFGDLRIGCAGLPRFVRVDLDALGALRCERDGERHQFFIFVRNRSVGHGGFVKSPESLHRGRGVRVKNLEFPQITHVVQGVPPIFRKDAKL